MSNSPHFKNYVSDDLASIYRKDIRRYCAVFHISYRDISNFLGLTPSRVSHLLRENSAEKITHANYISILYGVFQIAFRKIKENKDQFGESELEFLINGMAYLYGKRDTEVLGLLNNDNSQLKQVL